MFALRLRESLQRPYKSQGWSANPTSNRPVVEGTAYQPRAPREQIRRPRLAMILVRSSNTVLRINIENVANLVYPRVDLDEERIIKPLASANRVQNNRGFWGSLLVNAECHRADCRYVCPTQQPPGPRDHVDAPSAARHRNQSKWFPSQPRGRKNRRRYCSDSSRAQSDHRHESDSCIQQPCTPHRNGSSTGGGRLKPCPAAPSLDRDQPARFPRPSAQLLPIGRRNRCGFGLLKLNVALLGD
jgi:hypothetical protein